MCSVNPADMLVTPQHAHGCQVFVFKVTGGVVTELAATFTHLDFTPNGLPTVKIVKIHLDLDIFR